MYGSGQLPKFEKQLFKITDEDYHLYLIPTSEVAINGLHYDEILKEEELPVKCIAYTPCFRREAGAAGSQSAGSSACTSSTKSKCSPSQSRNRAEEVFEQMMASAEEILQGLNMHYRNMLLVTGDMSFAAAKTIDIEVLPPRPKPLLRGLFRLQLHRLPGARSQIRYRQKRRNRNWSIHSTDLALRPPA